MTRGCSKYKLIFRFWQICWLPLFLFPAKLQAQEINYKSQSLYIYKFISYIEWPEDTVIDEFHVGIYANSPIFYELEIMASIKKAPNGQNIIVKNINSIDEIDGLDILYIASSKSREMRAINEKIKGSPTLTVAERDGMARKGAIISFIILNNDILKFEINKTLLEKNELKIAPDLLKLGYIVG